jgi:hypothetical protein
MVSGLRDDLRHARQHGASRGFGVDGVALTGLSTRRPIRAVDFDDAMSLRRQGSRQSCSVGTGAFDTEPGDLAVIGGPPLQLLVAGRGGREAELS